MYTVFIYNITKFALQNRGCMRGVAAGEGGHIYISGQFPLFRG